MSIDKSVIFYNQHPHVGGANRIALLYLDYLKIRKITVTCQNNRLSIPVLLKQRRDKNPYLFLNLIYLENLIPILIGKILGYTIINPVYGIWALEYLSQSGQKNIVTYLKTVVLYLNQYLVFILSHKLIVLSKFEYELVQKYFFLISKKISVIYPVVDRSQFKPVSLTMKKEIRKKLGIPYDKKIILLTSRLEPRKGILEAIKACSLLSEKLLESVCIYLVLSSFGIEYQKSYFSEIIRQIEKGTLGGKVFIITGIGFNKIHNYYQAADLFLMSSISLETFGLTTLEAISCGLPVVAFDSGATPELLSEINSRLLTPANDICTFSENITHLLTLPSVKKIKLERKILHRSDNYTINQFFYKLDVVFSFHK